ncbi:2-hydroxyacid dehydrogenase [Falsihalocynthiibacter sp. SS001]|uniref:2-hydroxyacid dehydrogenase n=1 Tax=Falsihalocynthiibacter sp. SS001 TaxID=3349698 RepID=UPI0036D3A7AC
MTDLIMTAPMPPKVMEDLAEHFTIHKLWEAEDKAAFLAECSQVEFMATGGHSGCDAALMDALPSLRTISSFGVGYDGIDVKAAHERGINVTNTPDVLNDAVAELAMGMMLALCRRIVDADKFVREGKWPDGGYALTGELTGAKVGILGLGRIGKEIARRAQVFKMQVAYHGRNKQPYEPYEYYSDLTEMAKDVDWIIAVVPDNPATRKLVNRDVLHALGPNGAIVNLGRGTLIDEEVMLEMLKSGELGGAALDVFDQEPKMSPEFWELPNVVLSPHQGSATVKTRIAMGDMVVENLIRAKDNRPLLSPIG